MRITCPYCGERDIREFDCRGAAVGIDRPDPGAGPEAWDDFVHLRDNPAGPLRELWYHRDGCAAWLVVTRDTLSHAVLSAEPARAARRPAGAGKGARR